MNSLQLAQRLSRNLSVDDPANPSADALLDVLAAANAGIAAFYRELPAIYRRTTVSATLKQPQALNVVFQAKYSNKVGADTFSAGMFGCTVRLGQGPTDNIVTGPDSVLDDWIYDTLAMAAVVYFDAVPFTAPILRIIDDVRLYPSNGARYRVLRRYEGPHRRHHPWSYYTGYVGEPFVEGGANSSAIGAPNWYRIEPVGQVRGGTPPFLMQVSPMPSADFTIRFEAELGAQHLTFEQI
jgi:hypothetical protein